MDSQAVNQTVKRNQQNALYARQRVVITGVTPEIAGGRYAVKRVRGDRVQVEADIFADSHDTLSALLLVRRVKDSRWAVLPMQALVNDRWRGTFLVDELGWYVYTLQAWVDRFKTWHRDLKKKIAAGQDVTVDLLAGAQLVESAAERADETNGARLRHFAERLGGDQPARNGL